ncbi:hypothetical protein Tco_0633264, partial [Tanacetum coccineum]
MMIPYELLKLKNINKDGYTRFQHQEQYEHVGPEVTRSQEGKRSQDDDKRLCLVDDLKEDQVHIQVKLYGTSSSLKSMITTTYHKMKSRKQIYEHKTESIPCSIFLTGTPTHDIIEDIAKTIVSTIPHQMSETQPAEKDSSAGTTTARPRLATAK